MLGIVSILSFMISHRYILYVRSTPYGSTYVDIVPDSHTVEFSVLERKGSPLKCNCLSFRTRETSLVNKSSPVATRV